MLAEMTPTQLAEWRAYLDGIGETDAELNAATMTALVVNEVRDVANYIGGYLIKDYKPEKHIGIEDVLRKWSERGSSRKPERQSDAQIMSLLRSHG
jgi:hypothetical protein